MKNKYIPAFLIPILTFTSSILDTIYYLDIIRDKYNTRLTLAKYRYILSNPDLHQRIREAAHQLSINPNRVWWIIDHYIINKIRELEEEIK